jgi:hypothetical protein
MILPDRSAFPSFSAWQEEMKRVLEAEDDLNLKKNRPILVQAGGPIILVDSNGVQWQLLVATDGTLSTASLP